MKNTTRGRKASNTMKKNEGVSHAPRKNDQAGDGAVFAFNGQMGDGVNRSHGREHLCVNPMAHLVRDPDRINHGLMQSQRKGTASDSHEDRMTKIGPSATKDPNRKTIATAAEGHPIEPGYNKVPHVSNPAKIYITRAEK